MRVHREITLLIIFGLISLVSRLTLKSLVVLNNLKDLSILQYDVIFLSPDFLRKLRGFSKSFAYVGSVTKGNIG